MSLPRYPKYKNSDIDWTVELPAHWGTARLKWLCQRYSGGTPDKNRQEYWEGGTIPWLNSGAVNDGRIFESSAFITQAAFENSSAKWIPSGALVMALAGQGRTKGMVAQLMIESTCNQSMAAIVPNESESARFIYWWLVGNYQNIRNMAGGDLRDGLNLDLLGSIPCPLPPLIEQSTIAAFLDGETAKIDALITEQEQLLTLLAEKRQASISHAVTRGINPDVPMQESGVESLGNVPKHWRLTRIKLLFRLQKRQGFPEKEVLSVYRDFGVVRKDSRADNFNKTPEDLSAYQLVRVGDLVVNKMKAWQGSLGISPLEGITSPDYIVFEPLHSEVPEYLHYLLRAKAMVAMYRSISNGIRLAQWRLEPDAFLSLGVFLPPTDEQRDVVEYIDSEVSKIDSLMESAEKVIGLLEERRSALIAAAITGKIDVRNAVPQELVA